MSVTPSLPKATLIGLCSAGPGVGKDTFYNHLQHTTGATLVNLKFATRLEQEVFEVLRHVPLKDLQFIRHDAMAKDHDFKFFSLEALTWAGGDKTWGYLRWAQRMGLDVGLPRSIRWHMQQYGTSYIREAMGMPYYWVDPLVEEAYTKQLQGFTPVVTDVRNLNELEALRKRGATLVFIDRKMPLLAKAMDPKTEGLITPDLCDIVVTNKPGDAANMIKEFLNAYSL